MDDQFSLERFVKAQAPVIADVLEELRAGRKTSHWMWFVFPQIAGLGRSPTAQFFALSRLAEAQAYRDHPILGPRLVECTTLVNRVHNRTAHDIFGSPDDLKFHSSMTLFSRTRGETEPFRTALVRYFDGAEDSGTLGLLANT